MADGNSGTGSPVLAVLSVLNPLIVLVVGWMLNANINQQNLALQQQKATIDQLKTSAETVGLNTKNQIDKVKVIEDFLNDLTGSNVMRQRVAIQAIQIVLPPDESSRILEAVKQANPNSKLADEAEAALDKARTALVEDMFSIDQPRRTAALRALKLGRTNDEGLISSLLERASQDIAARQKNGFDNSHAGDDQDYQRRASIYNTADFLTSASVSDPALRSRILEFANAAVPNSPDTAARAATLKSRFGKKAQ